MTREEKLAKAFERHRLQDPHCTCNDCMLFHMEQQALALGEPGIMDMPPCVEVPIMDAVAVVRPPEPVGTKKVFIFNDDEDNVKFALIGPADFPLWKFWQEWWEKHVLPSAGTSPYNEWSIRLVGTDAEKQLRQELLARKDTVQGLRKQFSMEWYGTEDKCWSEIIGKILEIEHGFEVVAYTVENLYPEANW